MSTVKKQNKSSYEETNSDMSSDESDESMPEPEVKQKPGFNYETDKMGNQIITSQKKKKSRASDPPQPPKPVVLGPVQTDGAFGQYMLGQLNSLAKYAKVDAPLHTQFNIKGEKGDKKKSKVNNGVRIVDAAGMAADGEEGDGVVQGMFENQPFTDDQIKEAFFTFDMNGNGYIGVAEIRFVLDALGEDVTDEEIDEMVRMLDVDGDG